MSGGGARLRTPEELAEAWVGQGAGTGPGSGSGSGAGSGSGPGVEVSEWEAVLLLAGAVRLQGGPAAAGVATRLRLGPERLRRLHPLVFLAYRICDRRRQPRLGAPFNALGTAWRDLRAQQPRDP